MARVTKTILLTKMQELEFKDIERRMFLSRLEAHIKMLKAQIEDIEELLKGVVQ